MQEGKVAPVRLLSFRSRGARRVVSSTLAGETRALSGGCAEVAWLRAMWAEAVGPPLGRDWTEALARWPFVAVHPGGRDLADCLNFFASPAFGRQETVQAVTLERSAKAVCAVYGVLR